MPVLHFTEVVDDDTVDESFEELQSTSASVPLLKQMNDKKPYLVTSPSNMIRGHQDAIPVSCLHHTPIYNRDGIMKSNCLVSGSKDSTFRYWPYQIKSSVKQMPLLHKLQSPGYLP